MLFINNIIRSKIRNLITVLGISGGIAVFVVIGSISMDLGEQVSEVTSAYQADVIVMNRRATTPYVSRISQDDYKGLRAMLGYAVQPLLLGHLGQERGSFTPLLGVSHEMFPRIPLVSGTPMEKTGGELSVGILLIQRLGLDIGETLLVGDNPYRIANVFRTGSRLLDGAAMASLEDAAEILGRKNDGNYSLVLVQAGVDLTAAQIIEQINSSFPNLRARSSVEFAGGLRVLKIVESLSKSIMFMAFLGVCLVVTNAVLMAISERTRELGILMSIGWTPVMVLRMLMAETTVLCLAGAGLGNLFGYLLLLWLNTQQEMASGWVPLSVAPTVIVWSVGVAIGVALVSLLWPAVIVTRLRPAEALRYE